MHVCMYVWMDGCTYVCIDAMYVKHRDSEIFKGQYYPQQEKTKNTSKVVAIKLYFKCLTFTTSVRLLCFIDLIT